MPYVNIKITREGVTPEQKAALIWTGFQFTDLITLLKIDGKWRAINKVFHTHAVPS